MIRIGYDLEQKKSLIREWLKDHPETDRIFCFYGHGKPDFDDLGVDVFYCPYDETEMYRTFYPLLGTPYQGAENVPAITKDSLLVVDEMMVTKDRSALKYNCTHHFLRVSPHHIVFNWYPVIDQANDFMILLDFDKPDKYKGRSISDSLYLAEDCKMVKRLFDLDLQEVVITDKQKEKYQKKRDELFDNLGQKDPDTIPRNLALLAGDMKKPIIEAGPVYLARNRRIKKAGVYTYKDAPQTAHIILLDMQHRFSDFISMLMGVKPKYVSYVSTGLPVDDYYYSTLKTWKGLIESIYENASISE